MPVAAAAAIARTRRILEGLEIPGSVAGAARSRLDHISPALAEQDVFDQPIHAPAALGQAAEPGRSYRVGRIGCQVGKLTGIGRDIERQRPLAIAMDILRTSLTNHEGWLRELLEEELARHRIRPAAVGTLGKRPQASAVWRFDWRALAARKLGDAAGH